MASLNHYLDEQLSQGRSYFSQEEGRAALGLNAAAFVAAAARLTKKHRLVSPRQGFYLICRPEDRITGAPDPVRWIDPFMRYLGLDYRISLLRAAAFHGASHQAAMVFQVIAAKQLRAFEIGRYRLQFIYQTPALFFNMNRPAWLDQMKSEAGFAKVASVELTLLDSARYFHAVGGMNALAQIAKDVGARAHPHKLAKAAVYYENTAVRRLGYLLDCLGYARQAHALEPFARRTQSVTVLNPCAKPLIASLAPSDERNAKWHLVINEPVEIDF